MDEEEELVQHHDLDSEPPTEPEIDGESVEPKPKRGIAKPLLIGLASLVVLGAVVVGALFFLHLGPFAPPPVAVTSPVSMGGPRRPGGPGAPGAKIALGPGGKPMPGALARPGMPAAKPGMPGAPGAPAKPGALAKPVPAKPAVAKAPLIPALDNKPKAGQIASVIGLGAPHARFDPFAPYSNLALLHPPPVETPPLPPVVMGGLPGVASDSSTTGTGAAPPPPTPRTPTTPWHVAGIMTGDGIRAIVMDGDKSAVVQPGDSLPDSSANVVSITDTTVTLRTTGANPTDIPLAVTAGPDTSTGTGNTQGGMPGAPMRGI